MSEVVLKFSTKDKAIKYAKNNNIHYEVVEPKKSDFIIKTYDNFFERLECGEVILRIKSGFIGRTVVVFNNIITCSSDLFRCPF